MALAWGLFFTCIHQRRLPYSYNCEIDCYIYNNNWERKSQIRRPGCCGNPVTTDMDRNNKTVVHVISITTAIASTHMGWSTWLCFRIAHAPKRQCLRLVEILVAGCTGGCENDNFQCSRWWEFRRSDDVFVLVYSNGSVVACRPIFTFVLDWFITWWTYRVQLLWFHRIRF